MRYTLSFKDVTVNGTDWRTVAALILANTTGYRLRVVKMQIGGAGETPQNENVAFRFVHTNQAGAGTPAITVSTANMPKIDGSSIDSFASGGVDYTSAEPTAIQGAVNAYARSSGTFNAMGGIERNYEAEAPRIIQAQTLCLQCLVGTATNVKVSGEVVFETY